MNVKSLPETVKRMVVKGAQKIRDSDRATVAAVALTALAAVSVTYGHLTKAGQLFPPVEEKRIEISTDAVGYDQSRSVDGVAGSAAYTCISGDLMDLPDTPDAYVWSCKGTNGGKDDTGRIYKPIDGVAGSEVDTCISGTFSDLRNDKYIYNWSCKGTNGGKDDKGRLPKHGDGFIGSGGLNSCEWGIFQDLPDTPYEYRWLCKGINGGKDTMGTQPRSVDGVAGSDPYTCISGTPVYLPNSLTENRWGCLGTNGGRDDYVRRPIRYDASLEK